jgi:hypothetical protein
MEKDEAMNLLRGGKVGVAEWNDSMAESFLDYVDLSGVDLSGADLSNVNLRNLTLEDANLSGANLRDAIIWGVTLDGANLNGANLSSCLLVASGLERATLTAARLEMANISHTILQHADLRRADLTYAVFSGTILKDANLRHATCGWTVFAQVDLSSTIGLSDVVHGSPSAIDVATLFRSKGQIPVEFLLGCGVPENLIEYLPSLIGSVKPIEWYSCFISYSTKNEDFAKRLHSRMRDETLRVWFAPEDVKGGRKLHEQIDQAISLYDKLLIVLSEHSMQSEWVKTEIRKARKRERIEGCQVLFPIRLVPFEVIRDWECFDADSGKDLGAEIREYFIPDFSNWKDHDAFETAFGRLLSDLKKSTHGSA